MDEVSSAAEGFEIQAMTLSEQRHLLHEHRPGKRNLQDTERALQTTVAHDAGAGARRRARGLVQASLASLHHLRAHVATQPASA